MFNFFKKTKRKISLRRDRRIVFIDADGDWSQNDKYRFVQEDLEKISSFISKHTNLSNDSILSVLNIFLGDKYEFSFKEEK